MKTPHEIQKYRNKIRNDRETSYTNNTEHIDYVQVPFNDGTNGVFHKHFVTGMEMALDWVLKKPIYKRTVFDLTRDELKTLLKIVIPYSKIINTVDVFNIGKTCNRTHLIGDVKSFRTDKEDHNIEILYRFTIDSSNFDVTLSSHKNPSPKPIKNQGLYLDTIREMLTK